VSIVRWGEDGSNVYIIESESGWECVGCDRPDSLCPFDHPIEKFLQHIESHRRDGHTVPSYVESRLEKAINER